MRASDFLTEQHDELYEVRAAYGRSKKGPKIKFRCGSGLRANRLVSDPRQCFAHPNFARSQRMKLTRARTSSQQARKTKKTKQTNIASRIMQQLNKMIKR